MESFGLKPPIASPHTYSYTTSGFNPVTKGLTLVASPVGDFDADDQFDVADVDDLAYRFRNGQARHYWLFDDMFDVNHDSTVDFEDERVWVKDIKHTWFGDANLDGEFSSGDMVQVFQAGQYEDTIYDNSGWASGDWNADGDFTTSDLVVAFQDGGYEQGPLAGVAATVPEPKAMANLLMACVAFGVRGRRGRSA